jgi:asparagine synthase (glutamine-hydrolysing)
MIAGPEANGWEGSTLLERGHGLDARGADPALRTEDRRDTSLAVAVRHAWEPALGSGSPLHVDAELVVAADASLYYRDDIVRRLSAAGVECRETSSSALIAAAFRAWGPGCVEMLEGDYAFAIWQSDKRSLFAARDPFGTRSLFHWQGRSSVALSSVPDPLRMVAGDPPLNRNDLVRALVLYHGDGTASPWQGVAELPAGWTLEWKQGGAVKARRSWYPSVRSEWSGGGVSEAGAILSELIGDATQERMAWGGTAVGMSGGRDSTAMVGAVEARRARSSGSVPPLSVLSFRYPKGDPGNEDPFVREVESALGLDIQWLNTDRMPLFEDAAGEGGRRTRPEPHPFEGQNRALAAAARTGGARVFLNGNGGDNLFGLADSWMADLLRTGRWLRLGREIREKGYPMRQLSEVCLKPAIPLGMLDMAEPLLGRRILSRPWESRPPPWLRSGILETEGIIEEDREAYRQEIDEQAGSVTERIRLWAFLHAGFTRTSSALFDMSLDEGVELRMPFYDKRIADFAWSRPPGDLSHAREHKVILRHAMSGILPDRVIAARPRRTGTTEGYFRRAAKREFLGFARRASSGSRLGDLGLVDPDGFARAVDRWSEGDLTDEVLLFTSVCVEFWLRAQETSSSSRLAEFASPLHDSESTATLAATPPRG